MDARSLTRLSHGNARLMRLDWVGMTCLSCTHARTCSLAYQLPHWTWRPKRLPRQRPRRSRRLKCGRLPRCMAKGKAKAAANLLSHVRNLPTASRCQRTSTSVLRRSCPSRSSKAVSLAPPRRWTRGVRRVAAKQI